MFVSGGTVYNLSNQDFAALPEHAGHTVRLTGDMNGDTIAVSKVVMTGKNYNLLRSRVANQLCREDIAQVLFETGRCYHDTQMVFKNPTLDARHLHMLVGIPGDATSQTWFATSNASLRRSQESIGSEICSIIDCGTMKVRQKNLNASAGTLCGQV